MHEAYRDFIRLDSANAAYREFATGVANGQGAIAFHCTAGKDRTGWGAAMLQLFVGVDTDAVVAHYLESSARTSAEFAPSSSSSHLLVVMVTHCATWSMSNPTYRPRST